MQPDELICIRSFQKALALFKKETSSRTALPLLAVFLEVCANNGVTQVQLQKSLQMPQGTISRVVKELGQYYERENGKNSLKGFDLVIIRPDLSERRKMACFLSEKGRRLQRRLIALAVNQIPEDQKTQIA